MGPPITRSARDRKSTRLNSSHANISYAVFCLKKKKEAEEIDKAGEGKMLALQADISEHDQILETVKKTSVAFVGIDVLINNASAIFFFNDTATTEIYTLSLHDALPI